MIIVCQTPVMFLHCDGGYFLYSFMKQSIQKEKSHFTIVTNELISSGLSLKAIGLYTFMYSKSNDWNFTIRSMSKQLRDGVASITSAMNELKSSGWITYTKNNDGTGVYFMRTKPKPENPNLEAGGQNLKIPLCENPNMRKSMPNSKTDLTSKTDLANKTNFYLLEIPKSFKNDFFYSEWCEWKKYKKDEHRFSYKGSKSEIAAINKMYNLTNGDLKMVAAILKQSYENGYSGFFPLKKVKRGPSGDDPINNYTYD